MKTSETQGLLPIALDAVVLECKDVAALANFYIQLLGWKERYGEGGVWQDIVSPSGGAKIAFQQNEDYIPPAWPDEQGAQQQMAHLDFAVNSLEQMELAVQHAISCGAVKAGVQYSPTQWTTMLDPAGHPFCFVIW